jgi:uncharacterized damage-inducible protein DinB
MSETAIDTTTSHLSATGTGAQERADLLQTLRTHRAFLRHTAAGLTDAQARHRSTVSALTVGGLIKHVALTEEAWIDFVLEGPSALGDGETFDVDGRLAEFALGPDETLAEWLDRYDRVAARTDQLVAELPSLDAAQPLPTAPWFEPGATWSARRVLVHVVAETSQHAGHADIVREAIDGQRTMG